HPLQICIHEILTSFLVFSLPFYLPAPRNIAWVIVGANALVAIIFQKKYRTFFWQSKNIFFVLSAFLLWHFVGLIYTANTSWGWFLLGLLVPLWALPLALLTFPTQESVLRWYLQVFIVSMLFYVIITHFWAFYRAFRAWNSPDFAWSNFFYYENFASLRLSATYYAILLCLAILFVLIDFFFPKKIQIFSSKPFKIISLLIFFVTLMLLAARMQFFILVLGIFMIFLEYFRIKQNFWKGFAISSIILIFLVMFASLNPYTQKRFAYLFDKNQVLILDKNKDVSTGRNWDGASLRFAKWQCASELIQRNWLWGVGTGDGQDELQKIYEEYKFYFASKYNRYNAHNQFLETWIALGIAGIISFLGIFIVPLKEAWSSKNYLLLCVLLVFLLSAISESYLQRNIGVTMMAIFYGLGLTWHKSQKTDD
ncbi:MAG: O-antigen ligase family protein, partial [Raineya sp.]